MILRPTVPDRPDRAARRADELSARRSRLRHRFLSPEHFHHISSRTVLGRFAFHQFDPLFTARAWGIVAEATRRHHVEVAGFVLASNHFHALARARTAVGLSRWVQYVKSGLARLTNSWHGTRGTVWDGRFRSMTLLDTRSEATWFRYLLSHGVKEGLVADPRAWPGVHAANALCSGQGVEGLRLNARAWKRAAAAERSMVAFCRPVGLTFTPLTAWTHTPTAWRAYCQHVVDDIIQGARRARSPARMDAAFIIPAMCPSRRTARAALRRSGPASGRDDPAGGGMRERVEGCPARCTPPMTALIEDGLAGDPRAAALLRLPVAIGAAARLSRSGEDVSWSTPRGCRPGRCWLTCGGLAEADARSHERGAAVLVTRAEGPSGGKLGGRVRALAG
ncbi:MAG: transposase [bacterium]